MNRDKGRKWIWWFLAALVAAQLYYVQELLAAFALFLVAFVGIGFVVASIYFLQKSWETIVVRVADSQHPALLWLRRQGAATADHLVYWVRRSLGRPGSEPAR